MRHTTVAPEDERGEDGIETDDTPEGVSAGADSQADSDGIGEINPTYGTLV
jgi:hypothetical protein